jgi:hypothetical protein
VERREKMQRGSGRMPARDGVTGFVISATEDGR